jgi:hypothetical protein
MLNAGGNDEVFGLVLLQHAPLHFDIVACMAPIAEDFGLFQYEWRDLFTATMKSQSLSITASIPRPIKLGS